MEKIAKEITMKTLDEVIKNLEDGTEHLGAILISMETWSDALQYLKILKAKSEEPPLGNPPDYIPLDFHQLAEMIGEPVYIKERGCKGHWEIVTAVRKNSDGEDYVIRGNDRWQRIANCIYRTKEGAYENA